MPRSAGTSRPSATPAESPTARTLVLDVPEWPGHRAGHHVDVRLTAEDGYQASRSYSIASAPEHDAVELTIERFEDGEVSPYLVDEAIAGDQFEVRGPIGGPFTWSVDEGGPLYLIGGGSGMVPLMAMLRHRAAHPDAHITAYVLVCNRSATAGIYTTELETLTRTSGSTSPGPTRAKHRSAGRDGLAAWTPRCCARPARPTTPRKPPRRVRLRPDAVRRDGHAPARRPGIQAPRDPRRGLRHPGMKASLV